MSGEIKFRDMAGFLIAGALVSGPIIGVVSNPQVKRSWAALRAPNPNCAETLPDHGKYDVIAVFGLDSDGNTSPNQKMAVLQETAVLYASGSADKIVVIGDIPNFQEKSIFKGIKKQVYTLSDGKKVIGRHNVDFINHTVTYAEGMYKLSQFMETTNSQTVLGVSSIIYTKRLKFLSQNYGLNMSLIPAECFIEGSLPKTTANTHDIVLGEKLGIGYTAFDPHWTIANKFKRTIKGLKTGYKNR